jgi:two-component system, chemotaxis family, sensor histidine kinase and response regulator PixL
VTAASSRPAPRGAILLVDDDEALRSSLALLLEGEGFQVLEAGDGLEALAHLSAGAPIAMIVLDLQLPKVTGWDFREQQMTNGTWAAIPTVILTGASLSPEEIRWLAAKATLTKPFLFEDVLRFARAYAGV